MLRQALDHSDLTDLIYSEEEELYVLKTFYYTMNELSTTNQDEQYQEIHCRGGEGIKTLVDLSSSLLCMLGTITLTYNPTLQYSLSSLFRLCDPCASNRAKHIYFLFELRVVLRCQCLTSTLELEYIANESLGSE